jgi:hypothetical protein
MKEFALCAVACLAVAAASDADDLRLEYTHAGLTSVKVDQLGRLHFSWHTGRLDTPVAQQSLDGYDSHSAVIWLTKAELGRFKDWIDQYDILNLKSEYPESEKKTYGSAFRSALTVEVGGKKRSVAWTGDTKVPDSLRKAVNMLVQFCHEIRKTREEK